VVEGTRRHQENESDMDVIEDLKAQMTDSGQSSNGHSTNKKKETRPRDIHLIIDHELEESLLHGISMSNNRMEDAIEESQAAKNLVVPKSYTQSAEEGKY
jgi:hypothetical protein